VEAEDDRPRRVGGLIGPERTGYDDWERKDVAVDLWPRSADTAKHFGEFFDPIVLYSLCYFWKTKVGLMLALRPTQGTVTLGDSSLS